MTTTEKGQITNAQGKKSASSHSCNIPLNPERITNGIRQS